MRARGSRADHRRQSDAIAAALGFLLFAFSLASYWNSRSFEFVWDDQPYNLAGNPALMNRDYAAFWKQPYRDFYIPVSYSVWTWLAAADAGRSDRGLNPETFHTAGIFVHAANVMLAFYLLFLLIESPRAAAAGALAFAIHPLQVESVVWISELRGLLASGFSMVCLAFYMHWRRTEAKRIWLPIVSTVMFGLALLSKPSAAVLPLAAIAMDAMLFQYYPHRARILLPLSWLLPASIILILTRSLQPADAVEFHPSLLDRLFVAGDAAAFYLGKVLVPYPLSPSYGRTPDYARTLGFFHILWVIPVMVGVLAYIWRRTQPLLVFALILIAVSLAPVSGIVPFKGQNFSTVADRYFYFPMLGVSIAVAWAVRNRRPRVIPLLAVIAFLTAPLLFLNIRQQRVWQNELSLWTHVTNAYPNQPRAHNNLGAVLQAAGRHGEAIEQFNLALKARPTFADAHCNLGSSFGQLRDYSRALAEQTRALELDPSDGACWYNRALTRSNLGQFQLALEDLRQAEQHRQAVPAGLREAIRRRLGDDSVGR